MNGTHSKNNKLIYIILGLFIALFAALIVYILVYYFMNHKELINNSYNKRESVLLKENLRGTIYSSDGDILAYSVQNDDGTQSRIYPYGGIFAHSVGYIGHGKSGIEQDENYYLINSGDSLAVQAINASENKLNQSYSVNTTLDLELSQIADSYLASYNGAVIFTEVKTGKILAMVSHPTFDPTEIDSIWDSLIEDESDSKLINRVTMGQYPPGSTFKIFTALEYYRENGDAYEDYKFNCPGYYINSNYRINCYHGTNHGDVDFMLSFAKSCNSSFANIGMSLDRTEFKSTLNNFLFNSGTQNIGMDFKTGTVQFNISTENYLMMQTSIGQGPTTISPYHLNLVTMAIANNGTLMTPYDVNSVTDSQGNIIKEYKPEEYGELLNYAEADFLQHLMEDVVEEGTATRLLNDNYTAAGKTGSAEYNSNGDSHAWFTGYAPCDDPEVAVTIIIENGGSGGSMAVPLAKLMFDSYFSRN